MSLYYLLLYSYLATLAIALFFGTRHIVTASAPHMRILALLIACDFIVEILVQILLPSLRLNRYRNPIYNVFLLVELESYALFFLILIRRIWVKAFIIGYGIVLLPLIWFIFIIRGIGISNWNSPNFSIGGLFTVGFGAICLFDMASEEAREAIFQRPEFWIVLGLLAYFACAIPYFGMLNYLYQNFPVLATRLLKVTMLLNILMHSLFAYGFSCRTTKFS